MREIKFRAWDKEKKMMREQAGLCNGDFDCWPDLYYVITGHKNYIPMQYTGLKDKNGVEIYEGDLLKDGKGQIGQVLWHRNSYLVEWQTRNNYDGTRDVERMFDDCFGYGEIIGNIYENPELIK